MENLKDELNSTKVQSRSLPNILYYLANNIFVPVGECKASISTYFDHFFFQGSLSERRRSFKTEVSFESLFFCVGVGFGLIRKNSQIHSQPIICKSRTNRELGSRVFPRLATVARI